MTISGLKQEVAGSRCQVAEFRPQKGGFKPDTYLARGSACPMEGMLIYPFSEDPNLLGISA